MDEQESERPEPSPSAHPAEPHDPTRRDSSQGANDDEYNGEDETEEAEAKAANGRKDKRGKFRSPPTFLLVLCKSPCPPTGCGGVTN